uniref:Ubiquitin-conjugating enzyme E2-18 kDa n=1 Tax=Lygus hesperus TaxID=30085 RepID=A0A0A9WL42_LYGHE
MGTHEPTIPGSRRLQKELADVKKSNLKAFRELTFQENNIYVWHALICPETPPYKDGAFRVEMIFPQEYPFKPPKLIMKTKIYHPNFDEKGQVCMGMLTPENWKPSTSMEQVLQAYIALINDPDPTDALRADIGNELATDKNRFTKNAVTFTKKYAEKRPS